MAAALGSRPCLDFTLQAPSETLIGLKLQLLHPPHPHTPYQQLDEGAEHPSTGRSTDYPANLHLDNLHTPPSDLPGKNVILEGGREGVAGVEPHRQQP